MVLFGRVQPTAGMGAGPPAHLNVDSLNSHHAEQGFLPGLVPRHRHGSLRHWEQDGAEFHSTGSPLVCTKARGKGCGT